MEFQTPQEEEIIEGVKQLMYGLFGAYWETDANFKDTPNRVMRSYQEILMYEDHFKRQDAISKCFQSTFSSYKSSLIFAPNITTHSMCPHHLLPVAYNMTIAYIPQENGTVLGASKLERVARILSSRAVLQEDLTNDIVRVITDYIKPLGVAVVTSGKHQCMISRGIKTQGSFEVSVLTGSFKDNESTRSEFFSLMQLAELRRK